ncbi:hypothetical protein SLS56_009500 [Neofusicoccum ribis]|uniref:Uncharacterized protein n=1 Tax=Neofusicoccum ribis TaxID=45134 RepID=A0ABR3SH19_9PEZI
MLVLVPLVAADPVPEPVPEPKKPKGSSSNKNTTSDDDSMAAFGVASPNALNVVGMSFLAFLASKFL